MTMFVCARCGQCLTAEVIETELPAHETRNDAAEGGLFQPLMPQGTYAVDPERSSRQRIGRHSPPGTVVLNPADVPGAAQHPKPYRNIGCCGPDGLQGPNLVCQSCGTEIGTAQTDCWVAPVIRLEPTALSVAGAPAA